jgi:hypothetical protein
MSEVDDKKGVVVKFDPVEYEALGRLVTET